MCWGKIIYVDVLFQSSVSRYVLPEREEGGVPACGGMGGAREGEGEPGNTKEQEESSEREHICSKNNLLSQSLTLLAITEAEEEI